jgi:hypothetical protein
MWIDERMLSDTLAASLHAALKGGQTNGSGIGETGGKWLSWQWQQTGENRIAVAVADAYTQEDAQRIAAERLAVEVANHEGKDRR